MPDPRSLLVIIDPLARLADGESVRIARDVLSAGAPDVKVCLPEGPEEAARALARRGGRRPVVVGDDRALQRAVRLLLPERGPADCVLSMVPVGRPEAVALAGSLGVPLDAVRAARAVLEGEERRLDLLVDDGGGVVLDALCIPPCAPPAREDAGRGALERCRSLVRTLPLPRPEGPRLRVVADGALLAGADRPVERVSVSPDGGLAEVVVRRRGADGPVRARARTVTVSGPCFRYRADAVVSEPVGTRTWTARSAALRLALPAVPRPRGAPPAPS